MNVQPLSCGSCGSSTLEITNEVMTCSTCGTEQGRVQEMVIKGYNDKLWKIELDTVAEDGFFTRDSCDFMAIRDIKFELLTWHGPGGGNPLVRYTCSTYKGLADMIVELFQDGSLIAYIEQA